MTVRRQRRGWGVEMGERRRNGSIRGGERSEGESRERAEKEKLREIGG